MITLRHHLATNTLRQIFLTFSCMSHNLWKLPQKRTKAMMPDFFSKTLTTSCHCTFDAVAFLLPTWTLFTQIPHIHVLTHTHLHMLTHSRIHILTHSHLHMLTHSHAHTLTHPHTHTSTHSHTYLYIQTFTHSQLTHTRILPTESPTPGSR